MWSIGVADIATQNQPFVALVASVVPFQAKSSQFFAVFDSLVAITTHPGAQNSRSGPFRVNDDDNRRTNRLHYPLLCMRARGNKIVILGFAHDNYYLFGVNGVLSGKGYSGPYITPNNNPKGIVVYRTDRLTHFCIVTFLNPINPTPTILPALLSTELYPNPTPNL